MVPSAIARTLAECFHHLIKRAQRAQTDLCLIALNIAELKETDDGMRTIVRFCNRDSVAAAEGSMRPKKHEVTGSGDLFRARLDHIINLNHELVQLAEKIDWDFLDSEIAPLYSDKGRPGMATRFVIGLLLLKQIYGLSDEGVCERWVYGPYFQHFTGAEFFQH
jgi:hypothetical protein